MAVSIVKVGPGKLTFGAPDALSVWSSQVKSCAVEPDSDVGDPTIVLSGETVPGVVTETFKLTGTILQDLGAEESVSEWTWNHSGETLPFEYVPATAGGKGISGQATIVATTIGGDVAENAEADFEFPCAGKPAITKPTQA